MAPDEMKAARERLGWSRPYLARRLGVRESSVLHWETGRTAIPDRLAAWMLVHVAAHDMAPELPEGWSTTAADRSITGA